MIAPHIVDEVARLLADGRCSQRELARQLGLSRNTIRAIARGQRPRERRPGGRYFDPTQPLVPPRRCPTCGGLVYPPCRLCRVRQHIARQDSARQRAAAGHAGPLARRRSQSNTNLQAP